MDSEPAQPARVVVNMHVAPGQEEMFLAAWLPHAERCRDEPGVRQFEIFRSLTYPENFLLAELWDDTVAFERHFAEDHGRAERSVLVDVGDRRHGEDGLEIYSEQRLFAVENGTPVPTTKRGWGDS